MIDERHEELAALHALDLLEGAERDAFVRTLAVNDELRDFAGRLREASASLAQVAPVIAPPPALKSRVLAGIATSAPPRTASGLFTFPSLLPWAAAAGFALLAGWFARLYIGARAETQLGSAQHALADLALQQVQQQLEAERILTRREIAGLTGQLTDARTQVAALDERRQHEADLARLKITALTSLLKNSPGAIGVAVWNPEKQEGVLHVDKLPAPAAGQDYQLWVVDPQYPNPVDGGVFTVDPQTGAQRVVFKARQPVRAIDAFAVTLERKGGVPKAEGPFVLLGK
ncbi:MAG: anti-sigma factor [Verrucomicrobia bacterium]|nr:anti-sigma factor [Verrucomicrobiota bacterium]